MSYSLLGAIEIISKRGTRASLRIETPIGIRMETVKHYPLSTGVPVATAYCLYNSVAVYEHPTA